MPYIDISTNVKLDDVQAENIKACCGKGISLIPGKSEGYLMVKITDECRLWFQGDNTPCAMCSVSILGTASRESCEALTKDLCRILELEANIPPSRTYVKFHFVDPWGYDNIVF